MKEYFSYDPLTQEITIQTVQDVEGILDANKKFAAHDTYTKEGIKGGMWHYASIPLIVQLKWLTEYGKENYPLKQGNEKLLFKLLNSPEWKYLKATGKLHTARS